MENSEIKDYVLGCLQNKRIEGELYLIDSRSVKIKVLKGELEDLENKNQRGAGIRVFQNNRIGFSFASNLTEQGLNKTINQALTNSCYTMKDVANVLPELCDVGKIKNVVCYDSRQKAIHIAEKIELAQEIEKYAREYDKRITNVYETDYGDAVGNVFIANTNGIDYSYVFSQCSVWIDVIAKHGLSEQSGWETDFGLNIRNFNPEFIGQNAAQNAIDRLNPKTYRTAKVDIVLSQETVSDLFGAFIDALQADNVLKGKSLFVGKKGESIASENVTLINDGTFEQGAASSPIDDEGIATRETIMIKQGRLENFLQSSYTARKMEVEPTGSAYRSYKNLPYISHSNFYLKPGNISKQEVIKSAKNGIYIAHVMGLHTIDAVSGDFSLPASGRIIKDGEIGYAVDNIVIAGNIVDFLKSIVLVGNDLRFFSGGSAGQTILVENISVSGK